MRKLFLDLDGVLADFDGHYASQFGINLSRDKANEVENPDGMFDKINRHGSFFADLPIFDGALEFYEEICRKISTPVILTGLPSSVSNAEEQKRDWVRRNISDKAAVICCLSRDKYKHGSPGDVLIDDWSKYRPNWELMGGIFVLHKNFNDSIGQTIGLFSTL